MRVDHSGHIDLPQVVIVSDHSEDHIGEMKALALALLMAAAVPQPVPVRPPPDGSRDFDFEIGTWKTRLKRLAKPLSGSTAWVEYEGTSVVRRLWDGAANLVELDVSGPAGRIEGVSLRLYSPGSRQWSLNFAGRRSGALSPPVIGEFRDGRGEFHGQDTLDGRKILVRFVISDVTADSCRFEQAFSDDGGRTWEVNWIAIDTRLPEARP